MSMRRTVHAHVQRGISIALALYLLAALALKGQVLCIGADGHVAVEVAHGSSCNDPRSTPREHGPASLVDPEHCGPCHDVSLLSTEIVLNDTDAIVAPPTLGSTPSVPAAPGAFRPLAREDRTLLHGSGARDFVSSVRLLT